MNAVLEYLLIPTSMLLGVLAAWVLSGLTYDHLRHDVDGWIEALRERHERQLAHDREERQREHDYILMLMDRLIQKIRSGGSPNGGPPK